MCALPQLTSLVLGQCRGCVVYDSILGQLSMLSKLKHLSIPLSSSADLKLLPLQLQSLDIYYFPTVEEDSPTITLQHVTALRELGVFVTDSVLPLARLPAQLEVLNCQHRYSSTGSDWSAIEEFGVQGLAHLRRLYIVGTKENMLSTNVALKQIALPCNHVQQLARDWTKFPHLASLTLEVCADAAPMQRLGHSIATATGLTELVLHMTADAMATTCGIVFWDTIAPLSGLRRLVISDSSGKGVLGNYCSVSRLLGLTSLRLYGYCMPAAHEAVAALTCCFMSLTALQDLVFDLDNSLDIPRMDLLPVVGCHLQALRALSWHDPDMDQQQAIRGLQYLTDLSRLTHLAGFSQAGEQALKGFPDNKEGFIPQFAHSQPREMGWSLAGRSVPVR